jgi:transposase
LEGILIFGDYPLTPCTGNDIIIIYGRWGADVKFTVKDFRQRYPDTDACLQEIMRLRFGDLSECPKCKKETKFYRVQKRKCYECAWCAAQIYPLKDTVFEKTTTPLSDWFYVIYLMTATRSGVSAKEVERQLGVTYKCAWRMCHQIRLLMGAKLPDKLSGHVEIDEAYVGGRRRGNRGRGAAGKTAILGMVERGGNVKALPVPNVKMETVMSHIEATIPLGSRIDTDEFRSYELLNVAGYTHKKVSHHQKQYVSGDVHIQSVEGFWSRLKQSIGGTHIWVSRKHLNKYISEFAFRYNHRHQPTLMFDAALASLK